MRSSVTSAALCLHCVAVYPAWRGTVPAFCISSVFSLAPLRVLTPFNPCPKRLHFSVRLCGRCVSVVPAFCISSVFSLTLLRVLTPFNPCPKRLHFSVHLCGRCVSVVPAFCISSVFSLTLLRVLTPFNPCPKRFISPCTSVAAVSLWCLHFVFRLCSP
jgi:hypothetical protein